MGRNRRSWSAGEPSFVERQLGRFWTNALRGAVVTVVIEFVPLIGIVAPVLGGIIAGSLQNTGTVDGLTVGAVAGIVSGVVVNMSAPPRFFGLLDGGPVSVSFLAVTLLVLGVWTVTSAIGGAIGARSVAS